MRTIGVAALIILLIFGFDSLRRNAAKKNPDRIENVLTVSNADVTSASSTPTSTAETTSVTEQSSYIKDGIDEEKYKNIQKSQGEIGVGKLVLVNKDNSYKFQDISSVLVKMAADMGNKSYKLSYNTHEIQRAAAEPFNSMMDDFYKLYSTRDVTVIDSHKEYADQNEIYKAPAEDVTVLTSETQIMPGYTEHHSGYAIDLKLVSDTGQISVYDGTGIYAWINENCYKYGFIVRYPDGKEEVTGMAANPSHFRYVGVPHSNIMHDNGFTLEEYLDDLKKYSFGYDHLEYSVYSYDYEIYYVPVDGESTSVPVPKNEAVTVSGNNYDGFIVTVCRTNKSAEQQNTGSNETAETVTEAVMP